MKCSVVFPGFPEDKDGVVRGTGNQEIPGKAKAGCGPLVISELALSHTLDIGVATILLCSLQQGHAPPPPAVNA